MAICTTFINPLNLECLFINTLAGGASIFLILSIVAIALIAAFFKMSNTVSLIMLATYIIIFNQVLGAELRIFYLLVGLILGLIIFKISADIIKK